MRTKKNFIWFLLLAPLVLTCFLQASAGGLMVREHAPNPLLEIGNVTVFDLPENSNTFLFYQWHEDQEHDWVQTKVERKKKCRFLVRNCCASHYIRKGYSKVYNFHYEPIVDLDHEPAPDEIWHTRPRYYIFLFRLCPF